MSETNLVKYNVDVDDDFDEADRELKSGQEFLKTGEGKTRVRALPPLDGKKWLVVTQQHFIDLGPDEKVVFNCPRIMEKRPCPACAYAQKLDQSGKTQARKRAKGFYPKKRVYMNVVDRGDPEGGVKVWAFGSMCWDEIKSIKEELEKTESMVDPSNAGRDLIITRKGSGKTDTKYTVRQSKHATPLADDAALMKDLIASQPDLDRYKRVPTDDEIAEMLQLDDAESRAGDDDDEPSYQAPRRASGRASRTADDDAEKVQNEDPLDNV